jgi:hypothetical protein
MIASGDARGRVVLSDLNKFVSTNSTFLYIQLSRMTYIRSLDEQPGNITHIMISKTTCDVLVVADNGNDICR